MLKTLSTLAIACIATVASAADYAIDTGHSALIFSIKHLDLGYTYGRFNDFGGTITWDAANPQAGKVMVEAKIASIDTDNEKRDAHLKNTDVFDAGTFPTMSFEGTGFTAVEDKEDTFTVTGNLTIRGVSKEVTVEFVKTGEGEHAMAKKPAVGFHATFTINRSDFGVGQGRVDGAMGKDVNLIVSLEAIAGS